MLNSPYHNLAKWLKTLLEPVRKLLVKHSLQDTFELIPLVENLNVSSMHMCSIDVESLFTNVPLTETVDYVCNFIAQNRIQLAIPVELLRHLILLCTSNIRFYFQDKAYKQIDGVAMGSPLGPILADFFMAMVEQKAQNEIGNAILYKRYVDDILLISNHKEEAESFMSLLNSIHPNLHVSCEHEDQGLSFLDVHLTRRPDGTIQRRIFRKATWSGQYMHFKSFAPIEYKRGLVRTLFHRARMICSPECLETEQQFLTETLQANGYPEAFVKKNSQLLPTKETKPWVPKKTVYLEIQYKGDALMNLVRKRVKSALARTYNAASMKLLATTQPLPVSSIKTPVSFQCLSHCIYKFTCNCGDSYIGRTDRHLGYRLKEHIPSWLRSHMERGHGQIDITAKRPASSIARHLMESGHVIDPIKQFTVLIRNQKPALLKLIEAILIARTQPSLCVQKQLAVTLRLPWT